MRGKQCTNRSVQIHIPQAAGEEQTHFHIGLVCIPDAHPVVCNHRPHGVVTGIIPFFFTQLQHLLQLLPQMAISFCHK